MPGIVGIFGKERKMGMESKLIAPQFGIGKAHLHEHSRSKTGGRDAHPVSRKPAKLSPELDQRPASVLCVAELVRKQWSHRIVSMTKTHAVVEFTRPDGGAREERTILRDMLPTLAPPKQHGRPILHLGKTHRDHENGSWQQHRDNKAAHADLNRGHAIDHGAGTKGGGSNHGHHEKGKKGK
ncbi:MAG: hypothetical protein KBD19_05000 [Candidatus Moranbacteria bacterium]|nr:hypothetical protein [Candidatus Moranbacteria bacterium]